MSFLNFFICFPYFLSLIREWKVIIVSSFFVFASLFLKTFFFCQKCQEVSYFKYKKQKALMGKRSGDEISECWMLEGSAVIIKHKHCSEEWRRKTWIYQLH